MIGYVLLVALAIGLSIAVFFYLRYYLPSEDPTCQDDISLSINSLSCSSTGEVDIEIENRGLFTVDRLIIKIGEEGRVFKEDLQDSDVLLASDCNTKGEGEAEELRPGEIYCPTGLFTDYLGPSEVSVQAVKYIENKPVLCQNSVVTKKVNCG
jgi:hypothetical protein